MSNATTTTGNTKRTAIAPCGNNMWHLAFIISMTASHLLKHEQKPLPVNSPLRSTKSFGMSIPHTYLIQNEESTNSQLYAWTHNLVLPYLSRYESDYHLASVYAIKDNIKQQLPRKITNPLQTQWTKIGSKKKRTPPPSPTLKRPTTAFHGQQPQPKIQRRFPKSLRKRALHNFNPLRKRPSK
jgi:hypothetical protein